MSALVDQVLAALPSCKTAPDHYRLQVEIEKHATPADVLALQAAPVPPQSAAFGQWLRSFAEILRLPLSDGPQFHAHRLGESITLYSGIQSPDALILAFCGKADRLFMPIALILRYFAPDRHALMVLRDPAKVGFTAGIRGHSSSFRELVDRLRGEPAVARAASIRAFGTSGGGSPALAAGLMLDAATAVSFSGHLASASPVYGKTTPAAEFDAIIRGASARAGYSCVYGAANKGDADRAIGLASAFPVRLVPVPGVGDHNVVHVLHQRGQFAKLLRDVGLTA